MDRGRVELDEAEEVDRSQIILSHHLPLGATISNIHHDHLQPPAQFSDHFWSTHKDHVSLLFFFFIIFDDLFVCWLPSKQLPS